MEERPRGGKRGNGRSKKGDKNGWEIWGTKGRPIYCWTVNEGTHGRVNGEGVWGRYEDGRGGGGLIKKNFSTERIESWGEQCSGAKREKGKAE